MQCATFAAGAALAGLGGILGAELMPLEPYYALKYLVLVLVVVAVGGMGSLLGSLVAAVALGIIETASKYLASDWGSLFFFLAMALLLAWRPQRAAETRSARTDDVRDRLAAPHCAPRAGVAARSCSRSASLAWWLLAGPARRCSRASRSPRSSCCRSTWSSAIAGLATLGHAALFGAGAYAAGIFALQRAAPTRSLGLAIGAAAGAAWRCSRALSCCATTASPS